MNKTYKIYRFAYTDEVNSLIVPEDTKFYELQKSEKEYGSRVQGVTGNFHNCTYIAMIPWSKENEHCLEDSESQTLNLDCYNIANKWLYVKVDNMCPLSNDFPVIEFFPMEVLNMEPLYIKYRAMNQVLDSEALTRKREEYFEALHNDGVTEEELLDIMCPVVEYIKINRINEEYPTQFECVSVQTGSWLDDRYVCQIKKELVDIKDLIVKNKFIKTIPSNEREFNAAKEQTISNF